MKNEGERTSIPDTSSIPWVLGFLTCVLTGLFVWAVIDDDEAKRKPVDVVPSLSHITVGNMTVVTAEGVEGFNVRDDKAFAKFLGQINDIENERQLEIIDRELVVVNYMVRKMLITHRPRATNTTNPVVAVTWNDPYPGF